MVCFSCIAMAFGFYDFDCTMLFFRLQLSLAKIDTKMYSKTGGEMTCAFYIIVALDKHKTEKRGASRHIKHYCPMLKRKQTISTMIKISARIRKNATYSPPFSPPDTSTPHQCPSTVPPTPNTPPPHPSQSPPRYPTAPTSPPHPQLHIPYPPLQRRVEYVPSLQHLLPTLRCI